MEFNREINISYLRLKKISYHNIFIVDNRNDWKDCAHLCNKETDLILCIDFGLKIDLSHQGYFVQFLDHLVKEEVLNQQNEKMHSFLYDWNKNEEGENIISIEGLDLGNALLLYLINDISYFCHFFFNIYALKTIEYVRIYTTTGEESVIEILNLLELKYTAIAVDNKLKKEKIYFFPINQWMKEATEKKSFSKRIKQIFTQVLALTWSFKDLFRSTSIKNIYFQAYHPTIPIIKELILDKKLELILDNFILNEQKLSPLKQRVLQLKVKKVDDKLRKEVLNEYQKGISLSWFFENHDMIKYLSKYLDNVIYSHIDEVISKALSIKKYFDRNKLHLMVPITDLWLDNRLIMNYCSVKNIPVLFIMNGLLNNSTSREGKDSQYVNCYSVTCKEDFFDGAENVYALGDPRMDKYANVMPKQIDKKNPTIIIGAAGYDVTDINSYLAYEFDFLYDILKSISTLTTEGYSNKVVLKVRGNGYFEQYQEFVDEYFPELNVEIFHNNPFYEIIKTADLYISIFSQTQFEAACLGIPTIYYKKDTQSLFRPFDCKSELVTVNNIEMLINVLKRFYANEPDFNTFMQKSVLESYIGPLDGKNLERNINFINQILKSDLD